MLCEYGCGQEASYQFKNGKWCCSKSQNSCPKIIEILVKKRKDIISSEEYKQKMRSIKLGFFHTEETKRKISKSNKGKQISEETRKKISESKKGKKQSEEHVEKARLAKIGNPSGMLGKKHTLKTRKKISEGNKGKKHSKETRKKIGNSNKGKRNRTISYIKKKYAFFSQIEEMRYNPDKLIKKREIQVHCKNHLCPNSKEQDGWFTPTREQIHERIRNLEQHGMDNSYFYCCEECKNECPLYNLRNDPFQIQVKNYTLEEYNQFREFVLERDNNICQYCGEQADHVHHERPQKLEPFHALDPDYAWSCCKKCHYEKGHKDECSTGKLANIICL